MRSVKITKAEREAFRRAGERARKETEKRLGKNKLLKAAREGGRIRGEQMRRHKPCVSEDGTKNKRHRFWKGKCSLCGTPYIPPSE